MCGIAAFFAHHYAAPPIDRAALKRTADAMRMRGPDARGEWSSEDGRAALAHTRLSIIDLSEAASQPMLSDDRRYCLAFNGEIYNHRQLRAGLEAAGVRFRSHSDTEVVLRLYERGGVRAFEDLRGMYAVAVWDGLRRELVLARDPYGIKPLYYSDDGWTVRAASQVKALLAAGGTSKDPDPAGHVGYFLFGSVPEPSTLYRQVRQVPAGSWVRVGASGAERPRRFFSIAEAWTRAAQGPDTDGRVRRALRDSVEHHLVSDVEVGVFLSAGIDSSALLAAASEKVPGRIKAVTLAFDEFEGTALDEAALASRTAAEYGADHRIVRLGASEFIAELPRALEAMDQPTIDGMNLYFVSRAARDAGLKVALCGLGADELFGGYPSFERVPRLASVPVGRVTGAAAGPILARSAGALMPAGRAKWPGLLRYTGSEAGAYFLVRGLFMPWELPALIGKDLAEEGLRRFDPAAHIDSCLEPRPRTSGGRVSTLESSLYMRNQLLRDADWASMAHSLEIRTPWADAFLLREVAPYLAAQERLPGKAAIARCPARPIADGILGRKKTGFTLPMNDWLQRADGIDEWRSVPALTRPGTHWSRRWAYTVYRRRTAS